MLSRILSSSLGSYQASLELRWMQQALNSGQISLTLEQMVSRRSLGEPLQYILGTQPFGPLNLITRPPVLIPRPETEHWVLGITDFLSPSPTAQDPISLLDLGTGSGCIPLLLCHIWPPGSVNAHAVDISPHALRLAQDNAALCGIPSHSNDPKRPQNTFNASLANFLAEDFLSAASRIKPPFDIITSNPPYIPRKEYLELPQSVLQFEDPLALLGGSTGLDFYHAIARLVSNKNLLKSNGLVALEVGHNQATTVERLMRNTGRFSFTDIWTDPWGKQRTVLARI
ncbi:S-adenosyl-L-methionine-dependent methyltransferase [Phlegmacium glaucopus]|nr:S-adenosyl-L-methionine-dependent methyltransferase [Phlegmacium glaucopus]